MAIRLYLDHNVPRAVAQGLRLRGVDQLTALEDGSPRLADTELLDRAGLLGRVMVTMDVDLIVEARRRQQARSAFAGVVFLPQDVAISRCIDDLELPATASEPAEVANTLVFVPLR